MIVGRARDHIMMVMEGEERASCVPLDVSNGSKFALNEKNLLTGYQVMQKSALTVKRHFAATFVERWLVNPEVRVKLHPTKEGKNKMAAKRKAKAKGKAKKKAKKKGKK